MTLAPLVGSDIGYLYLRGTGGRWAPVLAVGPHGGEDDMLYSIVSTPADPTHVWLWDLAHVDAAYHSTDGGATWSVVAGFVPQQNLIYPKDESGRLYAVRGANVFRSSDDGVTWDLITVLDHGFGAGITGVAAGQPWAGDGFLHIPTFTVQEPGGFTNYILANCDYDGGGLAYHGVGLFGPEGTTVVRGRPGADAVYAYCSGNDHTGTLPTIWWVKASNPAIVTFYFDPFTPTPEQLNCIGVVSDSVAIAHTFVSRHDFSAGSLWRTADAGASWAKVYGPTTHLASGFGANNIESVTVIADHTDPSQVWVASKNPWVLHSTDAGLTWTEETVVATGVSDADQWVSIGLGSGRVTAPRVFAQVIG